MKKVLLLSLLISLSLNTNVFPQGGWFVSLNDSTRYFTSVFFLNENTGWAGGYQGVMVKTTNSGNSWTPQTTGVTTYLHSIWFVDENTGWAVGELGDKIIKTTNGGDNWFVQSNHPGKGLTSIQFTNSNTGWATGGGGLYNYQDNKFGRELVYSIFRQFIFFLIDLLYK